MKPYYEHAGITIYHGDCREVLPTLPKVDLVLTDPPYGINAVRKRGSQRFGWKDYEGPDWDAQRPCADLVQAIVQHGTASVVWGGNYFADLLPASMGWYVWDKGQRDFSLADCELAWTSENKAARVITYSRGQALQDGKQHPTQKPLAVILWCLGFFPKAETILDPFMGSGTTLVAAKQLGRRAIGIELEEKYCEIAAKRLSQEVLPMHEPAAPQPEQLSIV